jgi:hypothetical protein
MGTLWAVMIDELWQRCCSSTFGICRHMIPVDLKIHESFLDMLKRTAAETRASGDGEHEQSLENNTSHRRGGIERFKEEEKMENLLTLAVTHMTIRLKRIKTEPY